MVLGDKTNSKDFLQDALIAVRKHCSDPGLLSAWLQRDEVPSPRNLCALLRCTLYIDLFVGTRPIARSSFRFSSGAIGFIEKHACMGKDLFETTKPRKVTVTSRSILFPGPVTAYIEEYNLLIEVHMKANGTIHGRVFALLCKECICTQTMSHWTCSCRRIFLPMRFDLGRSFRPTLRIRNMRLVQKSRTC